jgi:hypothetical protein
MQSEVTTLRSPADSPVFCHSTEQIQPISGKEFLARVNERVDEMEADRLRRQADGGELDIVEYLKRTNPAPALKPAAEQSIPARFKREPDIFLGNLRFARIRLFLSKFIGDRAWRGVSL